MLAVVKEHLGPGFSVKEVPYPVLRDTDVIIRSAPWASAAATAPSWQAPGRCPIPSPPATSSPATWWKWARP